ncbi:TenA family protein [Actinosynnema sp. ALI-1.44]|uniref:TenA family protein n=1 Tax=Actinosynnema sp. ALI-1.44 TaxID=1933779 RepID=UPI0011781C72|nr:hypothetical protein [Actinosynnema sp. ALI-1.44]
MFRAELRRVVDTAAARILNHPYHRAMRDGSLPELVFLHFFWQDSAYLLPGYGRALSRCAGLAPGHDHARRLAGLGLICLENRADQTTRFDAAVHRLGLTVESRQAPPIALTTLGYISFLTSAAVTSLAAGLGALLPSAWLYQLVTDDLLRHRVPGSRYAEWIESVHPGAEYGSLVEDFVGLVTEVGERGCAEDRETLLGNLGHATLFEWSFVDAAWRLDVRPHAPDAAS